MALSASLAQAESESLSDAIKWGLKRGVESGESRLYARKCFGYNQCETGEVVINQEQAVVFRRIFDLCIRGYSIGMIIKELSCTNIKSPQEKDKWSKRAIQTMPTNEKYIGNVLLGKTYTGQISNNQQKVNRGAQEQYLMKNAHESIIQTDVFEEVQEAMKCKINIEFGGWKKPKKKHTLQCKVYRKR